MKESVTFKMSFYKHRKHQLVQNEQYLMCIWHNFLKLRGKKGIKPKFHVSEQGIGKVGKHSDYIDILPEYLLEIPKKYSINIDIMIEAKMKELSIQKLYEKYPQCNCLNIV